MVRRVLMIAHTFPPLGSVGGSVRLLSFLKYFGSTTQDWNATVLTVDDDEGLLFLNRNSAFALSGIPAGVKVLRSRTNEPRAPQLRNPKLNLFLRRTKVFFLRPLLNMFAIPDDAILWKSNLIRKAREELRGAEYSAIYATAPPFSVLISAANLSRETGIPLVLDIKDDWVSEERYRGRRTLRRWIEQRMEKSCMEAASRVIAVTKASMLACQGRHPEYADKIVCIPNGCDVDEFRATWADPPKKFEKFTIIHAGVIGGKIRDASGLLRAIARFIERAPESREKVGFIVFGRIGREQAAIISECNLGDVVKCVEFMDRVPYIEMLARAHLPVAVNVSVPLGTIPGKLYEYWASRNRQLLLESPDSAAAKLVVEHDIGDVVDPYDVEAITDVLHVAWQNYRSGKSVPVDIVGLDAYDRKHLTKELIEVLESITAPALDGSAISGKEMEDA